VKSGRRLVILAKVAMRSGAWAEIQSGAEIKRVVTRYFFSDTRRSLQRFVGDCGGQDLFCLVEPNSGVTHSINLFVR